MFRSPVVHLETVLVKVWYESDSCTKFSELSLDITTERYKIKMRL